MTMHDEVDRSKVSSIGVVVRLCVGLVPVAVSLRYGRCGLVRTI